MKEELEIIKNDDIKSLIYEVRGKQVMLDSDVAKLYHYDTKVINQTVKRNIARFSEDFCFRLTKDEVEYIELLNIQYETKSSRSQNVTLNRITIKEEVI